MECPRCGRNIGNMQVHFQAECQKQQETNRKRGLGLLAPGRGQ
jgi:predicted nucleic acid-binding Zn ribbon protein